MSKKLGGKFQDENSNGIPEKVKQINELIRLSQNRSGTISAQRRDDAIMELCRLFDPLIYKFAKQIYRTESNIPFQQWKHEAITTFIELVIDDYKLKEDGGQAFFGHYITSKLYFRLLYRAQKTSQYNERHPIYEPINFATHFKNVLPADIGISDDGNTIRSARASLRNAEPRVIGSSIANMTLAPADAPVIDEERKDQIYLMAMNILTVAKRVCNENEYQIFEMRYYTGATMAEIIGSLSRPIDSSRVYKIAATARNKVLAELGRQQLGQKLA